MFVILAHLSGDGKCFFINQMLGTLGWLEDWKIRSLDAWTLRGLKGR